MENQKGYSKKRKKEIHIYGLETGISKQSKKYWIFFFVLDQKIIRDIQDAPDISDFFGNFKSHQAGYGAAGTLSAG